MSVLKPNGKSLQAKNRPSILFWLKTAVVYLCQALKGISKAILWLVLFNIFFFWCFVFTNKITRFLRETFGFLLESMSEFSLGALYYVLTLVWFGFFLLVSWFFVRKIFWSLVSIFKPRFAKERTAKVRFFKINLQPILRFNRTDFKTKNSKTDEIQPL